MSSMIRLLDRPIAFHRPFVEITGSVKSALMLSQLVYWWHRKTGETVYKTRDDWWGETGLSKDEQKTAENILVRLRVISIKRSGVPPRNHYHLHVDRLEQLLKELPDITNRNNKKCNNSITGKPSSYISQEQENPRFKERESRDSKSGNPAIPLYTENTTETTTESTRARKRAAPFKPPTISEIRAYCNERGSPVDPEAFHDFYASKGWMVGKNKMKDWKAAVRTWERRHNGERVETVNGLSPQGSAVYRRVVENFKREKGV